MSIEIHGLTKRFGEKTAVDNLTLTIPGGMYGLLGPNGAGKTTLMRMLATLLTPTSGGAALCGVPLASQRNVRRIIGYLPQDFSFYPTFTVRDTLSYLALLSGMKDQARRDARIDALLEMTNLGQNSRVKVRKLSGGQRRRLGIAQVLLNNPKVIIVDEPTAGLDPEERIRFRNLLCQLSGDKTVLLSTHIAEDIYQTCENVAVLADGRLLYAGGVKALAEKAQGRVWRVHVEMGGLEAFRARHTVVSMAPDAGGFDVRVLAEAKPTESAAAVPPGLEDAYMLLVKGGAGV